MFQSSEQGAAASTHPAASPLSAPIPPSEPSPEIVRHLVFGRLDSVQHTIKLLHKLNYAEPHNWSKPIPTGNPNEVMVVLTKKVRMRLG